MAESTGESPSEGPVMGIQLVSVLGESPRFNVHGHAASEFGVDVGRLRELCDAFIHKYDDAR